MAFLDLNSINTYYGRSHILFDVSLSIEKGEVVSLIGRNGAGRAPRSARSSGSARRRRAR